MAGRGCSSNVEWQKWGEVDPLFGVASQPGRERGGKSPWTPEELLAAGERDWQDCVVRWERYGVQRDVCAEIGCGTGRITRHLSAYFARTHAIDVSSGMLDMARRHAAGPTVTFHLADGCTIPLAESSVTAVFSTHVFQHFDSTAAASAYFSEIARVLVPGGTFMIHLPIHEWPTMPGLFGGIYQLRKLVGLARAAVRRRLITMLGAEPRMRLLSYSVDWLYETLPKHGFEDIELSVFTTGGSGSRHPFVLGRRH